MKTTPVAMILALTGLINGCRTAPPEIYQWRGTNRNGIFPETGLLEQWPEGGPGLLWTFEGLGRGYAGPVVTGDQIFIMGEEEGNSWLFSLDMEGQLQWRSPNGKAFLGEGFSSTYPGARSTPTVVGNMVYATSGQGNIGCFDTSTGKELWSRNITGDLGGMVTEFGYTESLAADGKVVYCFPGGTVNNVVALNRFSGKVVWTSEAVRDTFAYGSPIPVDLPENKVLVVTGRHHLFTLDRATGQLLGSYPLEGFEYDGEHCNTVVFANGHLHFVANDIPGQGSTRLKISPDGREITEVWRNPGVLNNFGGLVVVDGYLFTMVKGNRLVKLDPGTGMVTDSLKVATGSIIYADNKFFCYGNNGTVNLVRYRNGTLEEAGELKVAGGTGHHFSHPVIAGGVMFIRRGDALMAYRVGEQATPLNQE